MGWLTSKREVNRPDHSTFVTLSTQRFKKPASTLPRMEQRGPEVAQQGFSSAKKSILTFLKREPGVSLRAIAASMGISRTGALKHLSWLEGEGLVERQYRAGRMGRPQVCFRLTASAQQIFPAAYTQAALSAMSFIEKHQGRTAVVQMLEERAGELRDKHSPRFAGKGLEDRVRELRRIRDEEGYMAELKRPRKIGMELLEHNCPILAIAGKYGEACDVERRLFHNLLGADVSVSHRVVAGDPVCRFLIKPEAPTR